MKGQIKHLPPNFYIRSNEGHVPNPGSDAWFSSEGERKIHIRTDVVAKGTRIDRAVVLNFW